MRHVTDREALFYLAGQFEAVLVGPRFSDLQLAGALVLYRALAGRLPRCDDILAEALVRNAASDVPERRGLAARLRDIITHPEKLSPDEEDES
jgi:hypothetical protein